MADRDLPTRTEGEGETLDMPEGLRAFAPGQVLGKRYQILEMLGRGGMGEVWQAFDLKLRVEVALKALRGDLFKSERRLELLRQEVRAAREVVSPNVCRIFDLIEVEGRELVSMEYVDGATLLGVLQERGPLDLKEAQDIASQFLAGLEAIHKVGLVHRDIKPENIMLTRAGRVVVMDFGLARQETEGGGSVSGTPAYMAPEQAAGQTLDARADVYSAGVVLAEMVCPEGIKSYESRQSVWEGVRSEPAKLPDSPWAPVLKKAVAKDREGRFNTAHTLTRALEDVTLRVEGAEDLHPYPGLASFTEEDAEYFFGREAEVEQMWRKLEGPARLFAIMGPSGAGKSSFLRAGLVAARTASWAAVVCTPGSSPMRALANAFVEEFAGDAEAMRQMLDFEVADSAVEMVGRWSGRHDHALLIVDQFEELFTQNAPDEQRRVADLLSRIVLESDVHVLLSMRDDFFFHCHQFDAFAPLQDGMTLIGPPVGGALRRALVRPATKCGYRFEDDELVEEMLAEVEGERGALPLLAFAAAQLWEQRDRETGHLTRQAYQDIGGVGGALARHAEATIDRIGVERLPIVRELFRNLVTAEGTRAVREWDELLSVFSDSRSESQPEEVLRHLIDARLLTSYEIREDDEAPTRRVEIIHESLLANWPRLVRWQTQDQEGAQLRDELRQSAQTWDEHGRHDDRLWAGTAYREFLLWRERYPGGLTATEEAFATAMISLANRRQRRRRIASVAGVTVLIVVLAVVTSLWRRSVLETRRAEASKLLTLGHLAFQEERTPALAYAIAALELSDTPEARRLALRSLWAGPQATILPKSGGAFWLAFSPDGSKLATGNAGGLLQVYSRDLHPPVELDDFKGRGIGSWLSFSPDSRRLVGWASDAGPELRMWETQNWEIERVFEIPDAWGAIGQFDRDGSHLISLGAKFKFGKAAPADNYGEYVVHRWPLDGGGPEIIGSVPATLAGIAVSDPNRGVVAVGMKNEIHLHRLETLGREPPRIIGRHRNDLAFRSEFAFDPVEDRVAVGDSKGHVLFWPIDGDGRAPDRRLRAPGDPWSTAFSPDGALLAHASFQGGWLWDLHGVQGAEPLRFGREGSRVTHIRFTPDGRWLATVAGGVALWPLTNPYGRILRGHEGGVGDLVFAADGSHVFTQGAEDGKVLSWNLSAGAGLEPTVVFQTARQWGWGIAVDTQGRFMIVGGLGGVWQVPLNGSEPTKIEDFPRKNNTLDPSGRYLAGNRYDDHNSPTMEVLDLETGQRWEIDQPGEGNCGQWRFDAAGQLVVFKGGVLSRWDPATGSLATLFEGIGFGCPLPDGSIYVIDDGKRWLVDLDDGSRTEFSLLPGRAWNIDSTGKIVVRASRDGSLLVWSLSDRKPHLLLGHDGSVREPQVSPDGKWIATWGADETVRLWPMPDLSKPSLHTLPRDELIVKLKALTNLRAVPSDESYSGYKIEPDFTAYRGWAEVPEW